MFAVFSPILFIIVFFAVFISLAKRSKNTTTQNNQQSDVNSSSNHVDGNGRTEAQNEYIAQLRKRAAERKNDRITADDAAADKDHDDCQAKADAHAHEHVGTEEHYEPIVGSLGGDSDEGCPDLDGVRLIAHDVAYDDNDGQKHFDRKKLARAMILGELLNEPRFKGPKKR